MMENDEHRLDRIEDKLDKLSEAVVCLARMEERLVTIFHRLDKIETRVENVETSSSGNKYTLRFIVLKELHFSSVDIMLSTFFSNKKIFKI